MVDSVTSPAQGLGRERLSDSKLQTNSGWWDEVIGGAAGILLFPKLSVEEVLSLAAKDIRVPAGATRFTIPGRQLFGGWGVCIDFLREDCQAELKEEALHATLAAASWRLYEEPLQIVELQKPVGRLALEVEQP